MITPTQSQSSQPVSLPPMDRRRRWVTVLLMLVVFLSGAVIGWGLNNWHIHRRQAYYRAHPEEAPKRLAARLKRTLRLSDEQARQVRAIIEKHWPRFQEIRQQMYPAFKDLLDTIQADVSAMLRPDQVAKWNDYLDDIRSRWKSPVPTTAAATQAATAPSRSSSGCVRTGR